MEGVWLEPLGGRVGEQGQAGAQGLTAQGGQ